MSDAPEKRYTDADWPHGLRCMDCDRLFVEGDLINDRLERFIDGVPCCEITCMGCAIAKPLIYTGVGSRKTPPEVLNFMKRLGYNLAQRGFTLRSGASEGADQAFESGCDLAGGAKEVFLPWAGYLKRPDRMIEIPDGAHRMAENIHPAWQHCSMGARKLHARNIMQVLGASLDKPCEFVICWTPNGRDVGGTRTAIICARRKSIPVYNIALPLDLVALLGRFPGVDAAIMEA